MSKDWASLISGMTFKEANAFFAENLSSMTDEDKMEMDALVTEIDRREQRDIANRVDEMSLMQMNMPRSLHGVKKSHIPERFMRDHEAKIVSWLDGFSPSMYQNVMMDGGFYEKLMALMANGLWARGYRPLFITGVDLIECNKEYPELKKRLRNCDALFFLNAGYKSPHKFTNDEYLSIAESILLSRIHDGKPTVIGDFNIIKALRTVNDVLGQVRQGALVLKCGDYVNG